MPNSSLSIITTVQLSTYQVIRHINSDISFNRRFTFLLSEFLSFQVVLFPWTSFFLKMPSLKLGKYCSPTHVSNKCVLINVYGCSECFLSLNTKFCFICFPSYVIEDGSPYMRSGKQNSSSTGRRGNKGDQRDTVDDLGDDMWNYMSFCQKDSVKDSIPDQQLTLQELTVRFKGRFSGLLYCTALGLSK